MCNYLDNIPLDDEEISEERLQNIKNSVLSRVKEEKAMSKRTTIKTITIAVAAATTAALSAMIASAEPDSAPVAADVEEAPETEVTEVAEDEAPNDEKVLDKPLSEDLTVVSTEGDYVTVGVLPLDDDKVVYYYYKYPYVIPADETPETIEEWIKNHPPTN